MFANRVALQIFDCSGLLCGKIIWLLRPDKPAGQPDIDHLNVTAEHTSPSIITARVYRGTPLLGRTEILVRDPPLRVDGRC